MVPLFFPSCRRRTRIFEIAYQRLGYLEKSLLSVSRETGTRKTTRWIQIRSRSFSHYAHRGRGCIRGDRKANIKMQIGRAAWRYESVRSAIARFIGCKFAREPLDPSPVTRTDRTLSLPTNHFLVLFSDSFPPRYHRSSGRRATFSIT